jgi:hypothetical protein
LRRAIYGLLGLTEPPGVATVPPAALPHPLRW